MKIVTGTLMSLLTLGLLFRGFFVSDAYAYIDPGSGSMFIQVIVGALVGVGVAIKMYWEKIKFKLSTIRSTKSENE
jgi:prepilin signal peptidase PulO-like enzyme (type II secretory pathway)